MSLIQTVVALIEEAGQGTADTLMPDCPGATRKQVLAALQNARYAGLIHRVGEAGAQAGKSTRLGIYEPGLEPMWAPKRAPVVRPVASVWELGSRA